MIPIYRCKYCGTKFTENIDIPCKVKYNVIKDLPISNYISEYTIHNCNPVTIGISEIVGFMKGESNYAN